MLTILETGLIGFGLWASFTYAWGAHLFLWSGAETLGMKTGPTERLAWFALSPFSITAYMMLLMVTKGTVTPIPAPKATR